MEGGNIEVISEVDRNFYGPNIHVNITGIYLYTEYTMGSKLGVQHLDFEGNLLSECHDVDGDYYKEIYIYDNDVYFVNEYYTEYSNESKIKCMHVDTGVIEVLYEKTEYIRRLYTTKGKIIFWAQYTNEEGEGIRQDGWMIMDLMQKSVECISNPYCNPKNVVDNPEIYDEESYKYSDYEREIVFFDLIRNIFWIEKRAEDDFNIRYWEPRALWGNRDKKVSDMSVWKIQSSYGDREYFDGVYHYIANSYSNFKSYDRYGNEYDWSSENGGHGYCDFFRVVGDYLFLNVAAYDEEQYPLAIDKADPIRKSWFEKAIPQEAIDAFEFRQGVIC